jgi:hypothetical protein
LRQADLRHETENFRFGSKPVEIDLSVDPEASGVGRTAFVLATPDNV